MLGILLNGRYRVIQALGSGGFGQTYVAEDILQPDCPKCVIKQFKPARQDQEFLHIARRLFATEVETLRKLGGHDQIPALLDDFEENQEFYLAQEYVEGQALSDEIAAVDRLDESIVVDILKDVLNVLEFVHQNHVIHRDIKPGNLIRRRRDGKIVLIDFGAVKEIQTQITTVFPGQTNLTVGIGTQGYGPSEQMIGKPRYSSDLYALGMTAIHALTGLQPFQLPTHPETGEVIWRDQARVSTELAAILTKMTRYHFSQRYQSAQAALYALEHPTEIVADQTQLPQTLPEYPSTEPWYIAPDRPGPIPAGQSALLQSPPVREGLRDRIAGKRPRSPMRASLFIGMASVVVTGLTMGIRQMGWLQPLELAVYDRMVQFRPDPGPDPRLLVVGITEADITAEKQFPISDRTLARVLGVLQRSKPRVIGLDLLRNIPQEPGRSDLLAALNSPNVIAITNLGSASVPATPAPAVMPFSRIGFNDFVLDPGDIVRRNLLFADSNETADQSTTTFYSFSLRLALAYLAAQQISFQPRANNPDVFRLGKAQFKPLESQSGGYQAIDARGYQIMLQYRSRTIARQVSLSAVLQGTVPMEWIKDKVVLIGTTAPSGKDLFSTPYSSASVDTPRMAGVLVNAQMVSQILSAALDGQPLPWFWRGWVEVGWIATCAAIGGMLAWFVRQPLALGLAGTALLAITIAVGWGIFLDQGWIPVVAPVFAATATGGVVIAYRGYWAQRDLA